MRMDPSMDAFTIATPGGTTYLFQTMRMDPSMDAFTIATPGGTTYLFQTMRMDPSMDAFTIASPSCILHAPGILATSGLHIVGNQ
jgi:hypothetical protein